MRKIANKNLKVLINESLKPECNVYIFDEIGSTNTALKKMAEKGAKEGTVVVAKSQTEGRGTQGRKFYSPKNGLYLSVLLRPKVALKKAQNLTVLTAVAVVCAIKKVLKIRCGIKWVNDIFFRGKKIGGILTESGLNDNLNTLKYAVVGIGLNLQKPQEDFPDDIKDSAGWLFDEQISDEQYGKLVAEIVNQMFKFYKNMDSYNYIKKYQKNSVLIQKEIVYSRNGEKHICTVIGIDKHARLVVQENNEMLKLSSGEISLFKI